MKPYWIGVVLAAALLSTAAAPSWAMKQDGAPAAKMKGKKAKAATG